MADNKQQTKPKKTVKKPIKEKKVKETTKKVKEVNQPQEEKVVLENQTRKRPHRFYYSFKLRLIINSFLFVFLLIFGINCLLRAFYIEEIKGINYSEHSNLDYKVYLKENDFYEDEYLPKDMIYVASLIDNIKIDFNYRFLIDEKIDLDFEYELLGKLVIQDESETNTYYEKVYNLSEKENAKLVNNTLAIINKSIEIDYAKYNGIANSFKNNYGLNTKSKLIVYFNVKKKLTDEKSVDMAINNTGNNMSITIPLSEKSVDINLDYKDINNQSKVLDNSKVVIDNIICLVISMLSIIAAIVFMIRTIRLLNYITIKKNVYDRYIDKILNEYDRLIVETTTPPIKNEDDKEKIVIIEKFTELLDVRDNLKQPIMYHVVTKHQKCQFYINDGKRIYLTTIKKVDLEVEDEKK